MWFHDTGNMWTDLDHENKKFFTVFVPIFPYLTATALKSISMVAYSIHFTILYTSTKRTEQRIYSVHTVAVFLPYDAVKKVEGERSWEDGTISEFEFTSSIMVRCDSGVHVIWDSVRGSKNGLAP